jgi:hypothetical protein
LYIADKATFVAMSGGDEKCVEYIQGVGQEQQDSHEADAWFDHEGFAEPDISTDTTPRILNWGSRSSDRGSRQATKIEMMMGGKKSE